jgi:outer membrane protein TolC
MIGGGTSHTARQSRRRNARRILAATCCSLVRRWWIDSSNPAKWLVWPSRFWSAGPNVSETVFDGGLRRALTDQARAAYDASVAAYRETVLTAFQSVEDNLAALRILEDEARIQDEAVKAAQQTVVVTTNQYKAGIVSYLNVITVQAIALTNETTAVQILGRRMTAAGQLVQALGGDWNVARLPSAADVTGPEPPTRRP